MESRVMMKKVDQIVSKWTEEEREKFKELIEECQNRERQLIENSTSYKEKLIKLTESLGVLFSHLYSIKKKTEQLEDDLPGVTLNWKNKKLPPS